MKQMVFGLVALMLAATATPAAAQDEDVARAILRELRMLRKEIQGLRKDLAPRASKLYYQKAMQRYQKFNKQHSYNKLEKARTLTLRGKMLERRGNRIRSKDKVIIIETIGPDGKRIRKLMRTDPAKRTHKFRVLLPDNGKRSLKLYELHKKVRRVKKPSTRPSRWHQRSTPRKARKTAPRQDRVIQLLRELLEEMKKERRGNRRHVEFF